MSAFLDETGTLITVDHSNPLPVALVAGFTSLNDGELKTASYANPLPVTVVTTDYTEAELPDADDVAVGTEVFNSTYQVKMRSNGTSWEWLGVGRSTWANKPAIAPLGQIICITDIGENGALFRSNGTGWVRMHSIGYYDLAATVPLTGITSETELATMTVKGGLMGAKGKLKIWPLLSMTNNANGKTIKLKMDGNVFYGNTRTNEAQIQFLSIVRNTNSQSVQKISSGITAGLGVTTGVVTSLTVNTSADFTISITGQLANSTDTLTLEGFFVEIV